MGAKKSIEQHRQHQRLSIRLIIFIIFTENNNLIINNKINEIQNKLIIRFTSRVSVGSAAATGRTAAAPKAAEITELTWMTDDDRI